jgi:hypothetical protein
MNCLFCNKPVTNRKKGDHIIPQGLGKFLPEITITQICRDCDSKNGSTYERIVLRTGILSFVRSIKRIKSNNNKRLPIHSPSLDKFNTIESKDFTIKNITNPDEDVFVSGSGDVRYTNQILIKKNGVLIETIKIPVTRDVHIVCDYIVERLPENLNDLECELNIDHDQLEEIIGELRNRGYHLDDPYYINKQPVFSTLRISSIITENHYRFVASIVLKAMIYLNYNVNLLCHLIEYVRSGNTNNLIYGFVDQKESGTDTLDDPPLEVYYHSFEWNITDKSINISASLLAHKKVNGIRIKLSLKTGEDTSIIIPFGKVIAKYGKTSNDGILEIFHGENKVV